MKLTIGIDASRNRSGGAKVHLIGILSAFKGNPPANVKEVHVWSYTSLLDLLPNYPWLKKHTHPSHKKNIVSQLFWQYFKLPIEAKNRKIDIMFNTDAGTVCPFYPSVTMSQDMLSYEKGEMKRFGLSFQFFRLLVLKYVQNFSLKKSTSAIFLTKYAAEVIQKSSGKIKNFAVIPHGVNEVFRLDSKFWSNSEKEGQHINAVYISTVCPYKHQIHVARAITHLRKKGFKIRITFVGGGFGKSQVNLEKYIALVDSEKEIFTQREFVEHNLLPDIIKRSDLFIFASSCENLPITLIEGMCSGLPIICSDRGPMPEVLLDGGVYFNPENYLSISNAIEHAITNEKLRKEKTEISKKLSEEYNWERCGKETFAFLTKTYFSNKF